jgi:cytochrome c oxidase subunit II
MQAGLPLFPEQASTIAGEVDNLYFFCLFVSAIMTVLISGLIVYYALKYKRRSETEIPKPIEGSLSLEIVWIVVPLGISMIFFFWGASVFFKIARVPTTTDAIDVYVVGKRWMWKMQHMDGQREINQLHVPIGRPVRLIMTSEDVIHAYYIPAFRIKGDVIPGRYNRMWFEANKTGEYHLFCAEYCGTKHSEMIGKIIVMEPAQYQAWLAGGTGEGSLSSVGQKLFNDLACNNCHRDDSQARGPDLKNVFGTQIRLQDGRSVTADETYIRESILNPNTKLVAGYESIMPTFQGLVTEEQVLQLIAYVRSIGPPKQPGTPQAGSPTTPAQPQGTTKPGILTPPQGATPAGQQNEQKAPGGATGGNTNKPGSNNNPQNH